MSTIEDNSLEINKVLFEILKDEQKVQSWWNTRIKTLLYQTPKEVFDKDPEVMLEFIKRSYLD